MTEVKKVNDLKLAGVQYTNLGYLPFSPVLSLLVNDSNPGFDFDHFSTEKASQHAYYRVSQQVLDNLVNIEKRRKIRESLLTI